MRKMNADAEEAESSPRCTQPHSVPLVLIAGDRNSLADFIRHHEGYLRSIVGSLVSWNSDTDDLVQEVLLRAWDKGASFRGEAEFKSWLRGIAINVCRNYHRSFRRYWRKLANTWESKSQEAAREPNTLENDQRWNQIQAAMRRLSYQDRELLTLVYLEELPAELIAREMNCTVNALQVRLHRARGRLTQLLGLENDD